MKWHFYICSFSDWGRIMWIHFVFAYRPTVTLEHDLLAYMSCYLLILNHLFVFENVFHRWSALKRWQFLHCGGTGFQSRLEYQPSWMRIFVVLFSRFRCPRTLRQGSAADCCWDCGFESPPGAWMFVSCERCMLTGRGLCDGPITRPEESYRPWCV